MTVVDRVPLATHHGLRPMFQSLFLWMTVVGMAVDTGGHWDAIGFQSLFLWMTVVGTAPEPIVTAKGCKFQSLLLWMTVVNCRFIRLPWMRM